MAMPVRRRRRARSSASCTCTTCMRARVRLMRRTRSRSLRSSRVVRRRVQRREAAAGRRRRRASPTAPTRCSSARTSCSRPTASSAAISPPTPRTCSTSRRASTCATRTSIFTTETGAPQGTMEAKRGVYSTRTQMLEGWGDVVVKLVDGRTLKSPHVIVQSGHAPDLERHDLHASRAAATRRRASGSRPNQTLHAVHAACRVCSGNVVRPASREMTRRWSALAGLVLRRDARAPRSVRAASDSRPHARRRATSRATRLAIDSHAGIGQVMFAGGNVADPLPGSAASRCAATAPSSYPDHDQMIGHAVLRRAALSRHVGLPELLPERRARRRRRRTCTRSCRADRRSSDRRPSTGASFRRSARASR